MKRFFILLTLFFYLAGPFGGVRPAHAVLPVAAVAASPLIPMAVGAALSMGIVRGATVYAPQIYEAGQLGAQAVDRTVSRSVVVGRELAVAGQNQVFGYAHNLLLGMDSLADYVREHASALPHLFDAVDSAQPVTTGVSKISGWPVTYCEPYVAGIDPAIQFVCGSGTTEFNEVNRIWFLPGGGNSVYRDSTYTSSSFYASGNCMSLKGIPSGSVAVLALTYTNPLYQCINDWDGVGITMKRGDVAQINVAEADIDPDIPPLDPGLFGQAIDNQIATSGQSLADEIDDVISENPPGVIAESPPAITAEQLNGALSRAIADVANGNATVAEAAAAADPTNTALQIAAQEARAAADQAAIAAQIAEAQIELGDDPLPPLDLQVQPPGAAPAPAVASEIDFTPLLSLKDAALGKFPFSAMSGLGTFFDTLTADPVAPAFQFPPVFGRDDIVLSLSVLDPIAAGWRYALAFFFHASCIYGIIRRYA